jgi:hypothetical protein
MKPLLSRSDLQEKLKHLRKKSYNRYQWWRRHEYRSELNEKAPFHSRLANGDFEASDYLYQAEMELYLLGDKERTCKTAEEQHDFRKLFNERHRRLQEDYQKDEAKLLQSVKKHFTREFGLNLRDLERTMDDFDGSLIDLYNYYAQQRTEKINFAIL